MTMEKAMDQVEGLIDKMTLEQFLNVACNVCMAKGDHLRSNWQDNKSAEVWERMASRLETQSEAARRYKV